MRRALFAVAVAACGHAAPNPVPVPMPVPVPDAAVAAATPDAPPPPLDDDPPRLAARSVAMFLAWQKALADAGDDCAAAAKNLNALADSYADAIAASQRVLHAGHDKIAQLEQALAPHDQELQAAAAQIAMSLEKLGQKCPGDAEIGRAIERLGSAP